MAECITISVIVNPHRIAPGANAGNTHLFIVRAFKAWRSRKIATACNRWKSPARSWRPLADAGAPLPLRDVARRTGLSPAKVHRYLVSLVRCELVHQSADNGHYGIGAAAIRLGLSGLRTMNVVKSATDMLPAVRDQLGETAVLAIWSDHGPVIVLLEESSRQIFMNVRVGSILPLLRSAVGRIFAAYLPWPTIRPLLPPNPPDGADPINTLLATVRRLGIGSVVGDLVPGVSALAAPVLDHRGQIVAAVGVLGRSDDLDVAPAAPASRNLKALALKISRQIGFVEEAGPSP